MKFIVSAILVLGLVACGTPDAERKAVLKELKDFTIKCQKNPQDAECKAHEANKGG